ncbi:hypothetical protein K0M31_020035 [Melipona bicolor]|uniref:Uncharacterized protein n=1 Tax=Melipona bicolor TaxID=60889 RepID=A0AA40G190_9HYME|nr:hypothetical protein K0M31_020035 [Melipona bicolor]
MTAETLNKDETLEEPSTDQTVMKPNPTPLNKEESLEEPLRDQAKPKSEPNVPNPKRRFPRRFSSRMKEVGPSVNSREEEQKGPGSFAGMENGCHRGSLEKTEAAKNY